MTSKREVPLPESDQELREFLDHATVGLRWVGPDGRILWANRAELDLVGYSESEYVGQHDRDVLRRAGDRRRHPRSARPRRERPILRDPPSSQGRLHQAGPDRRKRALPRRPTRPQPPRHSRPHRPHGAGAGRAASGGGDEPSQGRVPGAALPRAAHAARSDPGVARPPAAGRVRSGREGACARDHRAQRALARAHHRRPAPRFAHRRWRAHAPPAARRRPERGPGRRRCRGRRRGPQGPVPHVGDRGRPDLGEGRPRPAAAGRVQPAVERHQVHTGRRRGEGLPGHRRPTGPALRGRQRRGDERGVPALRLREVPAAGQHEHPRPPRSGAGSLRGAPRHRAPRWLRERGEPGSGPGQHVHGAASAGGRPPPRRRVLPVPANQVRTATALRMASRSCSSTTRRTHARPCD